MNMNTRPIGALFAIAALLSVVSPFAPVLFGEEYPWKPHVSCNAGWWGGGGEEQEQETDPKEILIRTMIFGDHHLSCTEGNAVAGFLRGYDTKALQYLHGWGFHVLVTDNYAPENVASSSFGPASAWYLSGSSTTYYDPNRRIVMRKDFLEGEVGTVVRTGVKNAGSMLMGQMPWGGMRETFLHEMGHAWDNYLTLCGNVSYPSNGCPVGLGDANRFTVKKMYDQFKAQPPVKMRANVLGQPQLELAGWSLYAGQDPDEYVAEGYRMFGQSYESRVILYQQDRRLYEWLEPKALSLYGK